MQHAPIAGTDPKVTRSIAATLNASADLLEHASILPLPILWLVLWILRPAEAIARDFAVEAAHDLYACDIGCLFPFAGPTHGDAATEAVRLASQLRVIAAILSELSARRRLDTADSAGYRVLVVIGTGTPFIPAASRLEHRRSDRFYDSS